MAYMNDSKVGTLCGQVAPRDSVASELVQYAHRLADRADALATRVHGKLHPVMTSDYPMEKARTGEAEREWPPLFGELRSKLDVMESALNSIENAMSRTEL